MSPWVRIDENAMDHPKIGGLPDGAFRLWVQGLAYCQKYLTDGVIGDVALRGLRAYSPKRRGALIDSGLWDSAEKGIQVHDYLEWNDSRETIVAARNDAKDRRQRWKDRRQNASRTETETRPETRPVLRGVVCSEVGSSERRNGNSDSAERAGSFVEWYQDKHAQLFGVGYIGNPQKDYHAALQLVEAFSDQQVRDAALVWFGQDDDFARNGTRSIPKFASRASACLQLALGVA